MSNDTFFNPGFFILRKEEKKKNPQQLSEVVGRACEIVIIKWRVTRCEGRNTKTKQFLIFSTKSNAERKE